MQPIRPNKILAEQCLLDIVLEKKDYRDYILVEFDKQYFYRKQHIEIYDDFVRILGKHNQLDPTLLSGNITRQNEDYIWKNIINKAVSGESYKAHIQEIKEAYHIRQARDGCTEIINSPNLTYPEIQEILAKASQNGYQNNINWQKLGDIYTQNSSEEAYIKLTTSCLKTKLSAFQERIIVHNGDLVILAGRPSTGKTAFCLKLGLDCAENDQHVGLISLEMRNPFLLKRLAHSKSKLDGYKGYIEGCERLKTLPFWIEDSPKNNLLMLERKVKLLHRLHGLDLLIIDYLGLLKGPKSESRTMEITKICSFLKNLARELDIPIILLSQFNRGIEYRKTKKPQLSDLRDSGAIEQDADIVLFTYRPFTYQENADNTELLKKYKFPEKALDQVFFIVNAKQRDGEVGDILLRYIPKRNYFCQWDFSHKLF
jgi:replicative DNA helicase